MTLSAAGCLSVPIDELANLVAASSTFQAWVNAADATEAKERVYRVAKTGTLGDVQYERPFALVTYPEGHTIWRGGYGKGQMLLMFEANVSPEYGGSEFHQDATYEFLNQIGPIMNEISEESEASGRLLIQADGIQIAVAPQRSDHQKEQEDYFQVGFRITYGLNN